MLQICLDCTAPYAVGLQLCPHCRSERSELRDGDPYRENSMPKISRNGGPSIRSEHGPEPAMAPDEGGVTSPGTSSSTSPEKPQTKPAPRKSKGPSHAPKTGSRSSRAQTGASTARSTDGDPTDGGSATAD